MKPLPPLRRSTVVLALLPLLFLAADWQQFRGPAGQGHSTATQLPTEWSPSSGILWKTELPGPGASSPIILGEQVFLTCYSGYGMNEEEPGDAAALRRHVVCFSLSDGKIVWNKTFEPSSPVQEYEGFQALHGYASSTPVTEGQSLFVFFGTSGVCSLALDGSQQWCQSVGTRTHIWGSGTSPVLHDNLVIANASVESGSLVAFDKSTGREAWRAEKMVASWNTPVLVKLPDGGTELVVNCKNTLLAFDPATGEQLWHCDGVEDYVCPSAVTHAGIVYIIGGRTNTALAVRAGGRGDVTETHVLWRIGKGNNVSSPVYVDGHLYWAHETRGLAYCVNAETGDVVYQQRLAPRPGRIYASPVVADGKMYVVSRTGGSYVLAAKPEFELLAHNEALDESIFNGSPAVADGKLLIRSDKYLYCLGQ